MDGHMSLPDRIAEAGGRVVAGLALQDQSTATGDPRRPAHRRAVHRDQGEPRRHLHIEARDLDHALELAKMTPIVEGGVEVRPLIGFQVVATGGDEVDPHTGHSGCGPTRGAVADAHRREWAYVLAATVRVTRDLDLAEDAVQEAYVSALRRVGARRRARRARAPG